MIEQAITLIVVADADVAALIGNKFRPSVIETRDDIPYADYSLIGEVEDQHSGGTTGVVFATIEIKSFGETPAAARQLDQTIRDVLCGTPDSVTLSKTMPRGLITGTGIDIRRISSTDLQSEPDYGTRGQSKGPFAAQRIYSVVYRRTT